jgi:hypothetical protein
LFLFPTEPGRVLRLLDDQVILFEGTIGRTFEGEIDVQIEETWPLEFPNVVEPNWLVKPEGDAADFRKLSEMIETVVNMKLEIQKMACDVTVDLSDREMDFEFDSLFIAQ